LLGFENISAHNGWAISLTGITIVFSGLASLSFLISQLHKILNLWENKTNYIKRQVSETKTQEAVISSAPETSVSTDMKESMRQYKILVDWLGEPFSLPELLRLAEKCGMDHPHSTVNNLILSDIIVPDGTGYYTWTLK
jgi:hypothetical protein